MTFSCKPFYILRGNAIEVLKQLPTKVDLVITSPAYYQQRIYGNSSSELGRESSVAEYISNLVDVFRRFHLNPGAAFGLTLGTSEASLLNIPQRFCIAMCNAGFHLMDHVTIRPQLGSRTPPHVARFRPALTALRARHLAPCKML